MLNEYYFVIVIVSHLNKFVKKNKEVGTDVSSPFQLNLVFALDNSFQHFVGETVLPWSHFPAEQTFLGVYSLKHIFPYSTAQASRPSAASVLPEILWGWKVSWVYLPKQGRFPAVRDGWAHEFCYMEGHRPRSLKSSFRDKSDLKNPLSPGALSTDLWGTWHLGLSVTFKGTALTFTCLAFRNEVVHISVSYCWGLPAIAT